MRTLFHIHFMNGYSTYTYTTLLTGWQTTGMTYNYANPQL